MIFGALFLTLLSTLVSRASPMTVDLDLSAITNSSNRILSHCYTPDTSADIGETNIKDCRATLLILAQNPDFTIPIRFSKNPRRGLKIPRGWTSGECIIFVSCENDRDAYTFRFADVLLAAKKIVDRCVGTEMTEKWGLLRWGGIDELGDSETFYVSVGRPYPPTTAAGSVGPVDLVNETLAGPAIDVS